jgi:hypothetical protein
MEIGHKERSKFDQIPGYNSLLELAVGDFELFCKIIDCGGFRVAAKQLGRTQSYVSRRLKAIELMMGGQLLLRTTRHLQMTPLGERFLTEARQFSSYSTYLKRLVDRQPAHTVVTAEQLYERAKTMGVYHRDPALKSLAKHAADPTRRLVTLTGTGGVGKTTVLRVFHAQLENLQGGASRWVEVTSANTPDQLLSLLANELFGAIGNRPDPLDAVISQLHRTAFVLMLDNAEQIEGAGEVLQKLLEACPALKVVVSSRRPLGCRLEQVLRIDPLSIATRECVHLEDALQHEGFDLMRIAMARHGSDKLTIHQDNWMHFSSALQLTGGLPLGIELLAARSASVGLITATQLLLQRIETSLAAQENRHISLYNCLLASWDLLSLSSQEYLVCCSCILEPMDFDEARTLATAINLKYPELVIDELLRQSLLENKDGVYSILAPVREFVVHHASTSGFYQRLGKQVVQWAARVAQNAVDLVYKHDKIDSALALATPARKALAAAIRMQSDLSIYCDPDIDLTIGSTLRLAFLTSGQTFGLASLMQISIVRSVHLSKNKELAAFALYQLAYAQGESYEYTKAEETIKRADLLDAPPSRRIQRIRRRLILDSAVYAGQTVVVKDLSRADYVELARSRGKTLNSYRESYAYIMLIIQEFEEVARFGERQYVQREFSSDTLQSLCGRAVIASATTMLRTDPRAPKALQKMLLTLFDRKESVMLRHRIDVICCGIFSLYLTGDSIDFFAKTLWISRLAMTNVYEPESHIACLLALACIATQQSRVADTHTLMQVIRYQIETSGARLPPLHSRLYTEISQTLSVRVDALDLSNQELTEYVVMLLMSMEQKLKK